MPSKYHDLKERENEAKKKLVDADKFEWMGNYTGSRGTVDLKCKRCGTVFTRSFDSIRHGKHTRCPKCDYVPSQDKHAEMIRKRDNREIDKIFYNRWLIQCAECGEWAIRKKKSKFCSHHCLAKNTSRTRKAKKRSTSSKTETISLYSLIERDNGICYICGGEVDITDCTIRNGGFVTGRTYPTIEHLIPLSKGGTNTWDNIKLAHYYCNVLKGSTHDDTFRCDVPEKEFSE